MGEAAKFHSSQLFVREACLNSDADGTVPNHIQKRRPNIVLTSFTRREGPLIVVPHIVSANATSGKVARKELQGSDQDTKGWQHVQLICVNITRLQGQGMNITSCEDARGTVRTRLPCYALLSTVKRKNGGVLHR